MTIQAVKTISSQKQKVVFSIIKIVSTTVKSVHKYVRKMLHFYKEGYIF